MVTAQPSAMILIPVQNAIYLHISEFMHQARSFFLVHLFNCVFLCLSVNLFSVVSALEGVRRPKGEFEKQKLFT